MDRVEKHAILSSADDYIIPETLYIRENKQGHNLKWFANMVHKDTGIITSFAAETRNDLIDKMYDWYIKELNS